MSKHPSSLQSSSLYPEKIFKGLLFSCSFLVFVLICILFLNLFSSSSLSIKTFGFEFLKSQRWDPVQEQFGALPFIYGTLVTALIAVLIAVPVGLGVSTFLTEWAPLWIRNPISSLIELLAAIPSVIYGLWGIFVLLPFVRQTIYPFVSGKLGFLPVFQGPSYGASFLAAGLILSIMILPTITAVSKEVMQAIPKEMREGVLALGGTRWEAVRIGVLKIARPGIVGAVVLGLGRALGETMAVTMVIGNRPEISFSLFHPGYSLASVIANEYAEASTSLHLSVLAELGLILFFITFLVNGIARLLIGKPFWKKS